MSGKAFGGAVVAGWVVSFLLGYLLWGMLFADFFANNMGSATGVLKEPIDMALLALGTLLGAALLVLIIVNWARAGSMGEGAKVGATVGVLFSLHMGLIMFATTNINTLTSVLMDAGLSVVHGAVVGAVIAVVAAKMGPQAG